ncbi:MAG: TIGR02996 domain-containing protein [Archangium sp.]
MTTEESELLTRIWARPEDDAPRLVYADWLMERQDPRGEFIRLQVESAALHDGHHLKLEYERRAAAVMHPHRLEWTPAVNPAFEWRFVRGFPASVKLAAPALKDSLAALERVPSLEGFELNFNGVTEPLGDVWARVFSHRIFERLHSLRLTWHMPQIIVRHLVEQPWLSRLESLQLSWVSLREESWALLGASSALRGLQTLELGLSGATDFAVEKLASLPWPKLTWLRLSNNQLGTTACESLAKPGVFPALQDLDVSWNRIGKRGGVVLTSAEWFKNLRTLDLSHLQVGDETCAAIAEAKPQHLRWLGLSQSRCTEEGVKVISRELPKTIVHTARTF